MNLVIKNQRPQATLASVLLFLLTLVLYWPVSHFEFITLDDPDYVTGNRFVTQGLAWPGIVWAFHTNHAYNWHPLTWLSHMLDVQLFGLDPGSHHLVNLLFHLANTVLLFLLFRRLTGALWRSALVAALFALHPLHIESVAWVSERKDVLSTLFGLLALGAYTAYVRMGESRGAGVENANLDLRNPKLIRGVKVENRGSGSVALAPPRCSSRITHHASWWYLLALFLFACSLMSKPMLVTFPFLLLLLDYWPLRRLSTQSQERRTHNTLFLLYEKVPFLALSAASSTITVIAQGSALASFENVPMASRIANVPMACLAYLGKAVWPHPLAMFYPYKHSWPTPLVLAALCFLLTLSTVTVLTARGRPWFTVGWFWFLGTLFPVIGLIQVGGQAIADRYTYFPLVGLFVAVAWGAPELLKRWSFSHPLLLALASAALIASFTLTRAELRYWANTETLCRHALRVTSGNALAHATLAECCFNHGRFEEAEAQFRLALEVNPTYCFALIDLGKTLLNLGRFGEAEARLQDALRLQPDNIEARRLQVAAYSGQKRPREVRDALTALLRLTPDWPEALNNLAWLLATNPDPEVRDGHESVILAERACRLTGQTNLWLLSTLAAAYAEAGRFDDAIATQQKVCSLSALSPQLRAAANSSNAFDRVGQPPVPVGSPESFRSTTDRLDLYRSRQPYRETQ